MKVYSNHPERIDEKILSLALVKTDNDVQNVSVGINFVSKWQIKKLNSLHRQIDRVTDVLSFPLLETSRQHCLQNFDEERNPVSKELELGDIVICSAVAKKQARSYGHSLQREIAFLYLHGFLHLLGYDHMNEADEKQMFSLAEEILTEVGLKRGENV